MTISHRDAELALQRLEFELHVLAQIPVERAERLVEQQHRWIRHDRPCERDALLLSARHLRDAALAVADTVQRAV
ncbi:hypothetical protein QFZ94_009020 [Paraburkholderia sp. JPY465]|uniref:hypothetical protein n=1 Tax=Paraburkholderia sp. JPY465 TaxID=3042285 RepID=UPI003D1C41C4